MSRRSSSSSEPTPDVYTGLLFVSLASLCIGIGLLVAELMTYDFQIGG
ncbi:MAG: hypothetical protein KF774_12710 [Planctomyces sp.]|nr:hypothetical protein [Planctomyces sp.]